MRRFSLAVFIILMVFAVSGCGKKTGLEGKVLDGKGKPIAHLKIIAKQVQPIKGYEQFETMTGADGSFSFKKLFPTSEYILFPWYEDWATAPMRVLRYKTNKLVAFFNKKGWITKAKMMVQSGPDGQTMLLASPMVIQPCISTVTGKLLDGRKRPMQDIKVVAKQVNPVPGYEQFEATTGADGSFAFNKLCPDSNYRLFPGWNFKTKGAWTVKTKGKREVLQTSVPFRFFLENGVVLDAHTGLQWAAHDNGRDISWRDANAYCLNYKGGGHADWRLPTSDELRGLYEAGIRLEKGDMINITRYAFWVSEDCGGEAVYYQFSFGLQPQIACSIYNVPRVLPVRRGK